MVLMWLRRCCEEDLTLTDLLDLSGADVGLFFDEHDIACNSICTWSYEFGSKQERDVEGNRIIFGNLGLIESSATSKIWKSRGRPAVPDHITVSFLPNLHLDTKKATVKVGMEIDKPP